MKVTELVVDPGLKKLLRPQTLEERQGLEESIKERGFLEDIKVWKGRGIVVDGMNRLEIYLNNQDALDPPGIQEMEFDSRADVEMFILENQLNRRNLKPADAKYLRGQLYNMMKGRPGGTGKNQHAKNGKAPASTAEVISQQTGVSPATVKRDAQFARSVDKIVEDCGEDMKTDLMNGKLSSSDILQIADLPPEQKRQAVQAAAKKARKTRREDTVVTKLDDIKELLMKSVRMAKDAETLHGGRSVHSQAFVNSMSKPLQKLAEWKEDAIG